MPDSPKKIAVKPFSGPPSKNKDGVALGSEHQPDSQINALVGRMVLRGAIPRPPRKP